ncbi:hypothetical protein D3C72_1135130 [compost metagenome]
MVIRHRGDDAGDVGAVAEVVVDRAARFEHVEGAAGVDIGLQVGVGHVHAGVDHCDLDARVALGGVPGLVGLDGFQTPGGAIGERARRGRGEAGVVGHVLNGAFSEPHAARHVVGADDVVGFGDGHAALRAQSAAHGELVALGDGQEVVAIAPRPE